MPELLIEASPPKVELSSEQAVAELKKLGGILVHYDDRKPGNPVIMVDATNQLQFQDEWTSYLPAFPQLRQIGLAGTPVSDTGLDVFADITELESLS